MSNILLESLKNYYEKDNNMDKLLEIIHQTNSKVSLRIIDWFVTNYSKKYNIFYSIFLNENDMKTFETKGYNDKENNPDVKDFGDFEVKRNSEGGLSSRREGIYRYAPTEGNDEVGLENLPETKKRKPRRLANIPLKEINEATTAQRMVRRNPFARNVKTIKLKYLY